VPTSSPKAPPGQEPEADSVARQAVTLRSRGIRADQVIR